MAKSTDGGATWSKPALVSTCRDNPPLRDTVFRVNSFPAAAAAPNGDLYAVWNGSVPNNGSTYAGTVGCADWLSGGAAVLANCHSAAVWSKSTDGGSSWTAAATVFTPAPGRPPAIR